MNEQQFNSILPIKIEGLVSLISEKERLPFLETLHYLYESLLYDALSREVTKLWHLSNHKLYSMLNDEKRDKVLTYPDYV